MTEGKVTEVKIEVNAEDGTLRYYVIHVRRLSSKDAALSNITLSAGVLDPEFSPDVTEYAGILYIVRHPTKFDILYCECFCLCLYMKYNGSSISVQDFPVIGSSGICISA